MFTGIVQQIGILRDRINSGDKYQLLFEVDKIPPGITRGESIAVNGVCLSVVDFTTTSFKADVMPATLESTTLGELPRGNRVNLELPLAADDLLGGHIVTGHVDGLGTVRKIDRKENARLVETEAGDELLEYMVDKGSVAYNGVSLTLMEVGTDYFIISLIPETWNNTALQDLRPGDKVNIETDIIGKYVHKFLQQNRTDREEKSGLDKNFLRENGFI